MKEFDNATDAEERLEKAINDYNDSLKGKDQNK